MLTEMYKVMKDAWAFRPAAVDRLTYSGGPIDKLFPWTGAQAGNYTHALYQSGEASAFQANYFGRNLEKRGLINSTFGPKIKSFPFYQDACIIHAEIRRFMEVLVNSYYRDAIDIANDFELQAWAKEAIPAQIVDFPSSIDEVGTLVEVLTHIAHLVSIVHGTLNSNSLFGSSGSLPFRPFAFHSPLPTAKAIADVMPFMPQVEASVGQIALAGNFNRPSFVSSNETMVHMFDDRVMLSKMNKDVEIAEKNFQHAMKRYSAVIRNRTFGGDGLCGGMPYCWTTLDPDTAGYWLTA